MALKIEGFLRLRFIESIVLVSTSAFSSPEKKVNSGLLE
jgi:hypothetical protein